MVALGACQTPAPPPSQPAVSGTPLRLTPTLPPPPSAAELAQRAALRELVAYQDRLYRVAAPLLLDNAPLCKRHARNLLGFTAKNKYSYSSEFVESAQKVLGLGDQLQIVGIMAGSGAAAAGIRSGDKLLAVEGWTLPQGQDAEHEAGLTLLSALVKKTAINLKISRARSDLTVNVPLTQACAFVVELGNTDDVAAYADGHRIMLTRGMLDFTPSDDELGILLATEMAHNVLGDVARQHMSAAVAAAIDNFTRIHPEADKSRDDIKPIPLEANIAADRLGLYMAVRAGYNPGRAGPFWSRLAERYPASQAGSYTAYHPLGPSRLSAIDKTLAEIKGKQRDGKPLTPTGVVPTGAPQPGAPSSVMPR
ncbi:MAG: peptidase M48 [Burkholderiaceae bacterium]|nr:peptidase M48 [Burkholderiaceae bacterium]